jgi:hypothetical protein
MLTVVGVTVMPTSTGAVIVNCVVPAGPDAGVAVIVTVPWLVAVATEEFAGKVALPEESGEADQVTALVRFCVEPSV